MPDKARVAIPGRGGVNRAYLSKLEKGASYPGLEINAKLSTEIEVKRGEFFLGSIWHP